MGHFITSMENGVHVIIVPAHVSMENIEEFKADMVTWVERSELHVLDFQDVKKFPRSIFAPISQFRALLRSQKRHLYSVNISRSVRLVISDEGLYDTFAPVNSLAEAMKKANFAAKTRKIDVTFINPFISATYEALRIQVNIEATAQKPRLRGAVAGGDVGIAGVIYFESPGFTGTISICFPTQVFLKIYEMLVSETHATITPEIEDFAGEFLSIVYGQAKRKLNEELGFALPQVIPEILSGSAAASRPLSPGTMILPFRTDLGEFQIEIAAA